MSKTFLEIDKLNHEILSIVTFMGEVDYYVGSTLAMLKVYSWLNAQSVLISGGVLRAICVVGDQTCSVKGKYRAYCCIAPSPFICSLKGISQKVRIFGCKKIFSSLFFTFSIII